MPPATKSSLTMTALAVTVALTLALAALTLAPSVPEARVPGSDKTHHFLAFFLLTLPIAFVRPRLALWVVALAVAYGGAIELIQPLVGRGRELLDFVADAAGSTAGAALGVSLNWMRRRLT